MRAPSLSIACLLLTLSLTPILYAAPTPPSHAQLALVSLPGGLSGADLERIRVGHQAGILKILDKQKVETLFIKGNPSNDVKGIDGEKFAPLTLQDRDDILAALKLADADVEPFALALMQKYRQLPHLQGVALLGVLASPGSKAPLSRPTEAKVISFLRAQLQTSDAPMILRQAVLALAIIPQTDPETVHAVLDFLKRHTNNWNSFTTVQFFDYHQKSVRAMKDIEAIRHKIADSRNPHSDQILQILAADAPPPDSNSTQTLTPQNSTSP